MIHYPDENIIVRFGELELSANAEVLMTTYLQSLKREVSPVCATPAPLPPLGKFCATFGGVYAGIVRDKSGNPDYHLFHATDEHEITDANWHTAREKAAAPINGFTDWSLPDCREARLLAINTPEGFDKDGWYWTATQHEHYADYAWVQDFLHGNQDYVQKSYGRRARPVRRVPT